MSRNAGGYSVRKVKSFRGNEGLGFNAELCRDGKPVAYVMDDAGGGMYRWEWYDREAPRTKVSVGGLCGGEHERNATPEEARLLAHVRTLPKEESEWDKGMSYPVNDEIFVGGLVDDYENDRRLRRVCKTKVLFRLEGDKEGEYRTVKAAYDERTKAWMKATYGDAVVEVLNEKYAA